MIAIAKPLYPTTTTYVSPVNVWESRINGIFIYFWAYIGKLMVMQIAFLHTNLQKLANWKISADKLICNSAFPPVVEYEHLEFGFYLGLNNARLPMNKISRFENLSWRKQMSRGYNALHAFYGNVNAINANLLSGIKA
jgi:hypothetical protein